MFYAQINESNVCIGILKTPNVINNSQMIEIDTFDMTLLGNVYDVMSKKWTPGEAEIIRTNEVTNTEIKENLLIVMNNLATIYPDKVDADLLSVLVKEGKKSIDDVPEKEKNKIEDVLKQ